MRHLANAIVDENKFVSEAFRDFDDIWFATMDDLRRKICEATGRGYSLVDLLRLAEKIDQHHNDFRLWELRTMLIDSIKNEMSRRGEKASAGG